MCGIFGFSLNRPVRESDLMLGRRGTELLKHRGPDGSGEWAEAARGIYLGHRRLAVIDTSAANAQPMTSGPFVVSFNGEIYNFKELRDELAPHGRNFATSGDTEVLLKAWEEWGEGAIDRFDGMFAFALYDGARLHLVSDPFGEKPLYYAVTGEGVYFASEAQPLIQLLGLEFAPCGSENLAVMMLGFVPAPGTGFTNLFTLPPATHVVIEAGKIVSERRYWEPPRAKPQRGPLRPLSEKELDRIHEDLLVSLRRRVRSDVPLGLFLSAGVDSATVAAMVAKDLKLGLEAFTVSFPDAADESAGAARIASFLGLQHRIVDSREDDTWRQAPLRLAGLFGVPNDNLTAISVHQMSSLARSRMTVALSGIGGDELFYGYNKYAFLYRHRRLYQFLPPLLNLARPLDPLLRGFEPWRKACSLFRGDAAWRFLALKNNGLGALLDRIPDARNWARTLFSGDAELAYLARDFDTRVTLPGSYISAVDRGSMRASLEVRTPFLSRRLFETIAGFDQRTFMAFGQKQALRRILYRYVPRSVLQDVKQGFVFPAQRYLAAQPDAPPEVEGIPGNVRAEIWRDRRDARYRMLAIRLCMLETFAKAAPHAGRHAAPARAAV
jgi:asparagine synthase (glutamine-hydrolysing)